MKIAILTQYYPPEIGAPQARLSSLAKWFLERGHEVYVLTAMPNYPKGAVYPGYGGLYQKEEMEGLTIFRSWIYPTKSVGLGRRLTSYFSFVCSSLIVGAAMLPRVDFLMTESPPLFLGISGFLLSRLKRARWIFNVSDLWPESAVRLGIIGKGLGLKISQALEAFCYRKAWRVTGQSREILQDIERRFPAVSIYHLSNGVDTHLFSPECHSPSRRREMGNGKGCIAIYAGLHGIAQGLDQVLEAASLLRDLDNLLILLVGDGPEKERLVALSRDLRLENVRFKDPYPHSAVPSLLASADIALITLRNKLPGAVPSKIYEAMGSALPIVLVAEGEAADIVSEAHAGTVVSPGDVKSLANAIRYLVLTAEERKKAGRNGRDAAVKMFDRKSIAAAFIDSLEESI